MRAYLGPQVRHVFYDTMQGLIFVGVIVWVVAHAS